MNGELMAQQPKNESLLISSFDTLRRPIKPESRRIKTWYCNTELRRRLESRLDKTVSVDSVRTFIPMSTAVMPGMSLRS